jgi:hypothetical protein
VKAIKTNNKKTLKFREKFNLQPMNFTMNI